MTTGRTTPKGSFSCLFFACAATEHAPPLPSVSTTIPRDVESEHGLAIPVV